MRPPHHPHTELLVLQATAFCNVDCSYCYLPSRNDPRRMTPEVVGAVFSKLLPSRLVSDSLTVLWHAGEPLVVPARWYEHAFLVAERSRPAELRLHHNFQSNGTLLDAGWIGFLRRTGAQLNLSIDGPALLHDRHRRTRRGGGTHAQAVRGLRMMQDAGLLPTVLSVLTEDTLRDPDALYDFYRSEGISDVAFNVEEVEAAHARSSIMKRGFEPRFRRFLRRFLRRMADEPGALSLRELQAARTVIAWGGVPDGFAQEVEPLRIISVDVSGRVSSFSPELLGMADPRYGDFTFGDIVEDELDAIIGRALGSALARDVAAGVAACRRDCAWFGFCRGGSPANKLYENGSFVSTETRYRRLTRQAVIETVLELSEEGSPLARASS